MREAVKQSMLENREVQENQRRLTEHIRSSGLQMRKEIPNDGNCLFHAIADQLERIGDKGLNHSDLRKLSVETLKNGVPGVSCYTCTPERVSCTLSNWNSRRPFHC